MEDAYQKMLEVSIIIYYTLTFSHYLPLMLKGTAVGRNVFAEIDLDKDRQISHEEMEAWFYRQHSKMFDDKEDAAFVNHPEGVDPNGGWTGSSKELKRCVSLLFDSLFINKNAIKSVF